jgi:hypothetical protein
LFAQTFGAEIINALMKRDIGILGIHGPAGKDEFIGHKRGFCPALTHQNTCFTLILTQNDDRCRIANCRFVQAIFPKFMGRIALSEPVHQTCPLKPDHCAL